MAEIYNITDWNIKLWVSTGGTREKCFVENPETEKMYFFKESIARYSSEFWSEIIASKIGFHLGFNLLDYNIGIIQSTVGCLCESMIDQTTQEMEHGINLIKENVSGFELSDRPTITFKDVETSFKNYKGFIGEFIDILIFDAIIGNQDRHSENWAIIRSLDITHERYNKKKITIKLYELYKQSGLKLKKIPFKKFFLKYMNRDELVDIKFAPIYDSGSSLAREISEDKIHQYINDDSKVEKYINKGISEIKWEINNKKINHFELLTRIKQRYPVRVNKTITRVLSKYDENSIKNIINQIDKKIPLEFKESKLSLPRKELILKFIGFRIQKLKNILSE